MYTIKVSERDFAMKPKRLRRNGIVPGSVFGGHLKDSVALQMNEIDLKKLFVEHHIGSRLNLDLNGKIIPVQLKEKELDPVSNAVLHVSFQALRADQKVNSVIHVVLENTDKVTALLEHMVTEIPYDAFPKDMIDTINIDVDGMGVGTVVTVADIKELQNDDIEVKLNPDEIIFRIVDKPSVEEETEEVAAEE